MSQFVNDLLRLNRTTESEMLVVVFDLTNFGQFSKSAPSAEVFSKMKEFNEMTSKFVAEKGGLVIKFLGDAGLCVFSLENAGSAILAMKDMKKSVDKWLSQSIPGSHLAVNCHVGPVTVGPTPGFNGAKQIDVLGDVVNICFTLGKKGFVISPQAFRSLNSDARKHFKKYTPPIVYRLTT